MFRTLVLLMALACSAAVRAQTLEQHLLAETPAKLAAAARESGDARRGAILFHQVYVGCAKCHSMDGGSNSLGPDLTKLSEQKDATDEYVVTSVLKPSADIRKGFESLTVVTTDGRTQTGLLVSRSEDGVVLRDPAADGKSVSIAADQIEETVDSKLSIMPAGIANQLGSRQQFLDLLSYVLQVRDGGVEVARKLQPSPSLIAFTLPEYESHVDHAGLIRKLDDDAFARGHAIYERLCINCHGNKQKPSSLPTALRFAEGKFRSGGDPYAMYRTLTHGFGLMVPQTWMVPQQKYDVIHYIREEYLRDDNAAQYADVTDNYLASLPKGDTFGPEPVEYAPWSDMDYGPSMINTFEVGSDGTNFAHKGIAVRLDPGPGGIAKGNKWAIFDHDTMRFVAAWTRDPESSEAGFVNWQGIHFDGRHGTHPRVVGDVQFSNPTGPGWAKPGTADFTDDQRVIGRDDNRYGPLPRDWAKYRGLHSVGDDTIIDYTVGGRRVLERFGAVETSVDRGSLTDESPVSARPKSQLTTVFTRTMSLGASGSPNMMLVATHPNEETVYRRIGKYSAVIAPFKSGNTVYDPSQFNGASHLQIDDAAVLDMSSGSFTLAARIRTSNDGVIFSKCNNEGPWVPGGKAFFVRGGRLTYDIGWVGAANSKKRVDDGKWHNVGMTWNHETGRVNFYIDDQKNGGGILKPKQKADSKHVAKIGFAAGNFPADSHFVGEIDSVAFFPRVVTSHLDSVQSQRKQRPSALWDLNSGIVDGLVPNRRESPNAAAKDSATESTQSPHKLAAKHIHRDGPRTSRAIFAGVVGSNRGFAFSPKDNRLHLTFPPARETENVVVWTAAVPAGLSVEELGALEAQIQQQVKPADLQAAIDDIGKPRWPEVVTTTPVLGSDDGPFAVDELTSPANNPWLARLRFTGHDFFDDGDRMAVCSWDGDVWLVSGLKSLARHGAIGEWNSYPASPIKILELAAEEASAPALKWQRIASGLFQPLGLKIVDGTIYLTCRDQLVILRDRNGDGETDFYECFNNDHQVTPHFHEFAMGLQRDDAGNFYYAKSARHALTAIVPHHGTLLRIPPDGSRTDILANGFRAANGVCLNKDGSFIVTDQEGHWNPKNRINWVREGGFYGNMFGYHDVTDDSNEAMEQPLCWITNAFDRSPAELMWIDNKAWGPLNGSLLNLSYGYGKVYVVPHEEKNGQMQGGMCEFPIPQFPTGVTRGRISPHDNALYVCGMFAWGSSQQAREGGLYRIRPTGKPAYLPVGLNASGKELKITFTDELDAGSATSPDNFTVRVWALKRTANYGSKHYDEHEIEVASARLSDDGRAVTLAIPELAKTWCMEIKCRLKSADGETFERVIHNTIHRPE